MVRLHMLNLRLGVWRNRRGTALVTPDREQIRRDADIANRASGPPLLNELAYHCLAILDALEHAEKETRLANENLRLREESQIPVIPPAAQRRINHLEAALDEFKEALTAALSGLEQAERERDEWKDRTNTNLNDWFNGRTPDQVEARLAAVPALVEAANQLVTASDSIAVDRDTPQDPYYEFCAAVERLRGRIAAYQETTK